MPRTITVLVLLTGMWCACDAAADAPTPVTSHQSLAAAMELAAQDQSLVLVVFGAEWCGPCKLLDAQTLSQPQFLEAAGPLHLAHVDVDHDARRAGQFQVTSIPELVLMSAEGKIVQRRTGMVEPADLLTWLEEGRQRRRDGLWLGAAPAMQSVSEAAGDPARLVQLLGEGDPATRASAARILISQRDKIVEHLIAGLADGYLGVRVGSAEVLAKLAPQVPAVDAWAPHATRAEQTQAVASWWARTGTLPPVAAANPTLGAHDARTAQQAISDVIADDPVRRTQAMTTLMQLGEAALEPIRAAIRQRVESGDQRIAWLLEDVRWAILIPDHLEQRTRSRRDLARGDSDQRQAAALRLAAGGAASLPALRELIDDGDALVRENAVASLGQLGGPDALAAMAVMLQARDPNLRMIAAQTLGKSKKPEAAQWIAPAVKDPNEVVAMTAIAALEEVKAVDHTAALEAALRDERWRVRAAAADALGKMKAVSAAPALQQLLDDPDPFVVRSAIEAISALETGGVDMQRLVHLGQRLPDLRPMVVQKLVESHGATATKPVERLFNEADAAGKAAILDALTPSRLHRSTGGADWSTLLGAAAASEHETVRARAAAALGVHGTRNATELLSKLLEDDSALVRRSAALQVLRFAAAHYGVGDSRIADFGALRPAEAVSASESSDAALLAVARRAGARLPAGVKPAGPVTPQRLEEIRKLHARWHERLTPLITPDADVTLIVGWYITGDGVRGLSEIEAMLARPGIEGAMKDAGVVPAMICRLPWPQGQPLLEKMVQSSPLWASLLASARSADPQVRQWLLDPANIQRRMAELEAESLALVAPLFIGEGAISLQKPEHAELLAQMRQSPSAPARALAVFTKGRLDPQAVAEHLRDADPWVRYAAVQGLMRQPMTLEARESLFGPLLEDASLAVATMAGIGIMEPSFRIAAGVQAVEDQFRYDQARVSSSSRRTLSAAPPPRPIARPAPPPIMESIHNRLATLGDGDDAAAARMTLALLLSQYDDHSALFAQLEQWRRDGGAQAPPRSVLVGYQVTRDPAFLPPIRQLADKAEHSYALRAVLEYLRGAEDGEARALRREINERLMTMPQ